LEKIPKEKGIDVRKALVEFHSKVTIGSAGYCLILDKGPRMTCVGLSLGVSFWQYYNAPRMTLTVIGSPSLDKLQRWVESLFIGVPSSSYPIEELEPWKGTPPFLPPAFGDAYKVVPVQDERQLSLTWIIPTRVSSRNRMRHKMLWFDTELCVAAF